MALNVVVLEGRLVAMPELKQTKSGVSFCNVTIAVDRKFKNKDGKRDCDFINVMAWRQQAEYLTKYFRKGSPIAVVGNINVSSYTDQATGQKRNSFAVAADSISSPVGSKASAEAMTGEVIEPNVGISSESGFTELGEEDNLPF